MDLAIEDRLAIYDVINLHGHLVDSGRLDALGDVFTPDVEYDLTPLGASVLVGVDAIKEAAIALGDRNPVAHHITNVIVEDGSADSARAISKGIGVLADGSCGSVEYTDDLVRTPEGWRIQRREVRRRQRPLGR